MQERSEIRKSQIDRLFDKVRDHKFGPSYLLKVDLKHLCGLKDQIVRFNFPVTALVGINGSGKTTILGAAAIAYKSVQPRKYFTQGGVLDNDMKNWEVTYELIDRKERPKDVIHRSAKFKAQKWRRDPLDRAVLDFGVNRTVPPIERKEFSQYAKNDFHPPKDRPKLNSEIVRWVAHIIGKDVSNYTDISFRADGRITLLSGETSEGVGYSEFHFGAGESSVIRMLYGIESLPEGSLVLVEEVENGLHPVAVQRLVEYFIEIAEKKAFKLFLLRILTKRCILCRDTRYGPVPRARYYKEN